MNRLDFSRAVKEGSIVSKRDYVDLTRRVLPLDELRSLPAEEAEWFLMASTWLNDYAILLYEFKQAEVSKRPELDGHPCLPGHSGPLIDNILTRGDDPPDFGQLETYGVSDDDVRREPGR